MTETLDAVIIGTGQAGKPLAGALAEAQWRTVIIERGRVGGTCIIDGCTPTKTMIASARVAYLARRASEYGVNVGSISVDMQVVRSRKRAIVDSFSDGSERGMRRHETLELVFGEARFQGPHTVEVELREGGTRRFEASHVFINAGTRPLVPQIPGLEDVPWLDNTSVMELEELPEHLLVMGGGFVGLEFAQMFRRFGSEVTVIEQGPRLAGREDDDIAAALTAILEEDGIGIRTGSRVERLERDGNGIAATVATDGRSERTSATHLLVAVGRTPNTEDLSLAAAGVETDERGYIKVSEQLETNVAGVYALGDVNGGPPFTHVAYDDYRVVRAILLGGPGERTTRFRMAPYTVFTDPQLGRVGLSERQAAAEGRQVKVATLPMARVARAIETGETRGLMKAVVDDKTGQILGAAVLGLEGGEILAVIQTAMMGRLPYTALRDGVFSHPTLAEALNSLFMTLD
jgi:pyruvate/2-oxoglutarate dehydrogenase complex dihydrolipoamide dehydrogenase (E3) component